MSAHKLAYREHRAVAPAPVLVAVQAECSCGWTSDTVDLPDGWTQADLDAAETRVVEAGTDHVAGTA